MALETLKGYFGDHVFKQDGEKVPVEDLVGMPVAIYFSAHWCPPCRGFTPVLSQFYTKHKKDRKFEIIFVSSDRDQKSFDDYFNEMPWLTIGFGSDKTEHLKDHFGVRGIPYLVVLNCDGNISSKEGRTQVMEAVSSGNFPWEMTDVGKK